MPAPFDHVRDMNTLTVLTSPDVNPLRMKQALDFAEQCLSDDEDNEDVPFEVWNARSVALDGALDAFEDRQDYVARDLLREFWMI